MKFRCINLNYAKVIILNINFPHFLYIKSWSYVKAQTSDEKDLGCITILKLASEKRKNAGEMIKYEKLKKLQKSFLSKYENGHFTKQEESSQIQIHNLKIKEKGKRYVNKGLQKCGLK